jgi:hypothetical protein
MAKGKKRQKREAAANANEPGGAAAGAATGGAATGGATPGGGAASSSSSAINIRENLRGLFQDKDDLSVDGFARWRPLRVSLSVDRLSAPWPWPWRPLAALAPSPFKDSFQPSVDCPLSMPCQLSGADRGCVRRISRWRSRRLLRSCWPCTQRWGRRAGGASLSHTRHSWVASRQLELAIGVCRESRKASVGSRGRRPSTGSGRWSWHTPPVERSSRRRWRGAAPSSAPSTARI